MIQTSGGIYQHRVYFVLRRRPGDFNAPGTVLLSSRRFENQILYGRTA